MNKNSASKDTEILWIGNVPDHWIVKKIKHTTYVKGRIGWQALTTDEFIDEGAYLVTGTDFIDGEINWDTCYHVSEKRYNMDRFIQLKENDILITKDGTIGKTALVQDMPDKACLNSGIFVTRPLTKDYITEFMFWILNSNIFETFIDYIKTGSTISHLYQNVFENFSFPVPPIYEQIAIAKFLGYKTQKIDSLINKKQKVIGLLKEKRSVIINKAVTKGLDPTASMKDSGVEWLGEVPEHWKVKRLKWLSRIETGEKDTVDREENGIYPFFVRSPIIEKISTFSFDGEAVLTAGDGVGVGKVFHYINGKFDYHQRVYKISNFKEITGKYLFFYMKAKFYEDVIKISAKSTVDSLRLPMLLSFPVAFGDMEEQYKIVERIEKKVDNIDKLVQKEQNEIELLKEFRTSLISEAVTGKIDVRNEV